MPRILLLLICCLPLCLSAQSWVAKSKLPPVTSNAYHDVYLPPSVTALLGPSFGNLRLLDSAGQEVPYLFRDEDPVKSEMSIRWLPASGESYWARWYSRKMYSNPGGLLLDRLVLRIRNADVSQRFWLSGSDDGTDWYIIKEDYAYQAAYNREASSNLITIHFPPVDYKYFKVELRHYWEEPIQIMGAGVYEFDNASGNFTEVPGLLPKQREEGKESLVEIPLDAAHYLDRVFFEVDGPELYHREAILERRLAGETGTWEEAARFNLSSKTATVLPLQRIRAQALRLRINNKDDKPLRIAGARAWQTRKYLTARLEPKVSYQVVIGQEDLRAPEYDLTHFEASLPAKRPVIWAEAVERIAAPVVSSTSSAPTSSSSPAPDKPKEEPVPLLQNPMFLWGGMILIIGLLGYMSFRMLKEMGKKGE